MLPRLALFLSFAVNLSISQALPPPHSHCKLDPTLPDSFRWFATSSVADGRVYAISVKRKSKILANYSKLRLGMNSKEVAALLGNADYEEAGFRNSGFRSDGSRDLQERCSAQWGYYFKKAGENLADVNDSILIVEFDSDRKLTWAAPQNIPELSPIGSLIK
jgi:outer membrane protein assembly factor BamE (lipoprotein component of BamABCDE complex)